MAISILNFDDSLPNDDSFRDTNTPCTIRYITGEDSVNLSVMDRVFGDIVFRMLAGETKINELVNFLNANPNFNNGESFDNTIYILRDGTHAFTAPQPGVTPTLSAHLATKGYADGIVAALGATVNSQGTSITALQAAQPQVRRSPWTEHIWSGGTKAYIDLTLAVPVSSRDNVVSVVLMMKIDVATSGSPVWVYREAQHGCTLDGIRIDDVWLVNSNLVRVLIPNTSSFATGYPNAAQYNLQAPRQIFFRAVVTEVS